MVNNSTVSKFWAFIVCWGIIISFMYFKTDGQLTLLNSIFVTAPFALLAYFTLGAWFIAPIIKKALDKIDSN